MKQTTFILLAAVVALLVLALTPHTAGSKPNIEDEGNGTTTPNVTNLATSTATTTATTTEIEKKPTPKPTPIAHRQEVWLYALEWCESRAVHSAINEVDLDGTASYYAFQFKPGTFRGYGEKYGVIPTGLSHAEIMELLKSYELQREIVKNMIYDDTVKWHIQFPACTRLLGLPPR